jgi:hypothetical protein
MQRGLVKLEGTVYPAWYADDVLSESQCQEIIKFIDEKGGAEKSHFQTFDACPEIAKMIVDSFNRKTGWKVSQAGQTVTLSKHTRPLFIHMDGNLGNPHATHKLAIYLNDLSSDEMPENGSTLFYSDGDGKKLYTTFCRSKVGRAALFDLAEFHSGGPIPENKTKYMIGIRVSIE